MVVAVAYCKEDFQIFNEMNLEIYHQQIVLRIWMFTNQIPMENGRLKLSHPNI